MSILEYRESFSYMSLCSEYQIGRRKYPIVNMSESNSKELERRKKSAGVGIVIFGYWCNWYHLYSMDISRCLIKKNRQAYEVLAKINN